jgi:hypothetical protein
VDNLELRAAQPVASGYPEHIYVESEIAITSCIDW